MSNAKPIATPATVCPHFFSAALAVLRGIVLGTSVRVCEAIVTRTSLLGYDVAGVLHGASIEEVAEALSTMRGRVQAALAQAGEHLRDFYMLRDVGRFHAEYGMSRSAKKPVARISFRPTAPLSMQERRNIIATAIYYLREAVLGASQAGELEIRCMAM